MSAPIAASGPAVEKAAGPKATADPNHADEAANPFDAMLGVALATPPPSPTPSPVQAPEPKLLELVLDGDWMLDQPAEDADAAEPASKGGTPAPTGATPLALFPRAVIGPTAPTKPGEPASEPKGEEAPAEPAPTLEGLDDWIGLVTGRDRKPTPADVKRPAHPAVVKEDRAVPVDPALDAVPVPLGLSLSPVGVGSVAAGSVWHQPLPAADRPVLEPDAPVVPDAAAKTTDRPELESKDPRAILLPDLGGTMHQVEADAEELIKRLAPFHRAIEIGGFTFPLAVEPDGRTPPPAIAGHPTIQPPAPETADHSSPPIRVQSLPDPGGLDFGGGRSPTSGGSNSGGDDQPPQQRLPVITPPPPQSEGRLSDLLIRARREVIGAARAGPNDKPRPAEKDPAPPRAESAEPKPAAPTTPAPPSIGPTAVKRPEIVVDAPAPKSATLDLPAATPRRIDHVMVDLKDDTGDHGRLRLALSGTTVRATILPNDPALADRLTAGIRELRVSLEERGFAEPRLTVQLPKSDPPVGGHLFGRDVVSEVTGLAAKGDSQAAADEDPRGRWQADHSDRQPRDQRPPNRHQREPQDEGRTE